MTLTEVLVALVVIAVAFMALASVQLSNLSVTRESTQVSTATQEANKALEKATLEVFKKTATTTGDTVYKILDFYDCPDATAVTCSLNYTYPEVAEGYTATVNFTGLYREPAGAEMRTVDEYLNEGLIRADVVVTGPAEVSFSSYISCYDVAQTTQLEPGGDPCQKPYEP